MEFSRKAYSPIGLAAMSWALLVAARPKQWTKNLIVYLAFFFTVNEAWDPPDLGAMLSLFGKSSLAFVIFCALTSAVYLINDVFDIEKDRAHPRKRFRPIASGALPIPVARSAAAALLAAGLSAAFLFEPVFGVVSFAYVAAMVAYTLLLKRLILVDVFVISGGFVLRAVAGATVLDVPISPWLYICTGLGALFLALAKRRSELALAGDKAANQRETLEQYTIELLDQYITIVATAVALAYSLYTFTAPNLPDNNAMMLTIPFVVYGLFRYMFLVHKKGRGEAPEDILTSDKPLIISIILWVASVAVILGVFRG
ncbi:MAG: decaprenyl-phosphate phosphoribosyltransferase [Chloroflexi bacterium]|nr:decaprenyl-phosphate phosphoribosyltransferase [Chloroflexota bacterium]